MAGQSPGTAVPVLVLVLGMARYNTKDTGWVKDVRLLLYLRLLDFRRALFACRHLTLWQEKSCMAI